MQRQQNVMCQTHDIRRAQRKAHLWLSQYSVILNVLCDFMAIHDVLPVTFDSAVWRFRTGFRTLNIMMLTWKPWSQTSCLISTAQNGLHSLCATDVEFLSPVLFAKTSHLKYRGKNILSRCSLQTLKAWRIRMLDPHLRLEALHTMLRLQQMWIEPVACYPSTNSCARSKP